MAPSSDGHTAETSASLSHPAKIQGDESPDSEKGILAQWLDDEIRYLKMRLGLLEAQKKKLKKN